MMCRELQVRCPDYCSAAFQFAQNATLREIAGNRYQRAGRHRAAMLGTPRGTSYLWAVRLAIIPRMAREQLNARFSSSLIARAPPSE